MSWNIKKYLKHTLPSFILAIELKLILLAKIVHTAKPRHIFFRVSHV